MILIIMLAHSLFQRSQILIFLESTQVLYIPLTSNLSIISNYLEPMNFQELNITFIRLPLTHIHHAYHVHKIFHRNGESRRIILFIHYLYITYIKLPLFLLMKLHHTCFRSITISICTLKHRIGFLLKILEPMYIIMWLPLAYIMGISLTLFIYPYLPKYLP